jgi:N utilization substance protein B
MINMISKKTTRRILREKSLQVLYAYEMSGDGLQFLLDGILTDITNKNDKEFSAKIVNSVIANRKELDATIAERVNNWEMDRIALIDRILLRIGIAELFYFPDIPPKVSINEVIEIAKDYSTSNSGKFINGILDAILTDLKQSGKLKKVGRGLIDQTISKDTRE